MGYYASNFTGHRCYKKFSRRVPSKLKILRIYFNPGHKGVLNNVCEVNRDAAVGDVRDKGLDDCFVGAGFVDDIKVAHHLLAFDGDVEHALAVEPGREEVNLCEVQADVVIAIGNGD